MSDHSVTRRWPGRLTTRSSPWSGSTVVILWRSGSSTSPSEAGPCAAEFFVRKGQV